MARKNRKSKFKQMHQKDLSKNKNDTDKVELNLTKLKKESDQVQEIDMDPKHNDNMSEDAMEIEGNNRHNKIRKNKLFQKRAILEEKQRLKRHKRAPILVGSKKMQIE